MTHFSLIFFYHLDLSKILITYVIANIKLLKKKMSFDVQIDIRKIIQHCFIN